MDNDDKNTDIEKDENISDLNSVNEMSDTKVNRSWLKKMTLFEKIFWGVILALLIVYIVLNTVAYNTVQGPPEPGPEDDETTTITTTTTQILTISPTITIKKNIIENKLEIEKDVSLKLKEINSKADLVFKNNDFSKSKKLEIIHKNFLYLLKKHLKVINKYGLKNVDYELNKQVLIDIIETIKKDKLFVKIKQSTMGNTNFETLKVKTTYQELFYNISERIQSIYINQETVLRINNEN